MCARRAAYIEISILGFTTHAMTSQVAVYTPAEVGTGCHPTGGYPFRRWGGPVGPGLVPETPNTTNMVLKQPKRGSKTAQTAFRRTSDGTKTQTSVGEMSGKRPGGVRDRVLAAEKLAGKGI